MGHEDCKGTGSGIEERARYKPRFCTQLTSQNLSDNDLRHWYGCLVARGPKSHLREPMMPKTKQTSMDWVVRSGYFAPTLPGRLVGGKRQAAKKSGLGPRLTPIYPGGGDAKTYICARMTTLNFCTSAPSRTQKGHGIWCRHEVP